MKTIRATRTMTGLACLATLLLGCGTPRPQAPGAGRAVPFLDADAYYALGRAEHAAGRTAQARRAWELALKADPRHADARNGMAVLLAEGGDHAGAAARWRALLAERADAPAGERAFLLGNLGYALFLRGERDEALAALEQACLLDPLQPLAWEHLGAVLAALGDTGRAQRMMRQAHALRTHDLRQDHVLAGVPAAVAAPATPAGSDGASPWPAGFARTEIRRAGAVFEVHRVAAPDAAAARPDRAAGDGSGLLDAARDAAARDGAAGNGAMGGGTIGAGAATGAVPAAVATPFTRVLPLAAVAGPGGGPGVPAALQLEIRNGNGVRGMAAALARRLDGPQWAAVRLTNEKSFTVPVTRVEYRGVPGGAAALAQALASRLGLPAPTALPASAVRADSAAAPGAPPPQGSAMLADLRIVLGRDRVLAQAR